MRRPWTRATLLATLTLALLAAASGAGAADPGGAPTITAATLSGPVEPSTGYSGHGPSAPAPARPTEVEPTAAESIVAGAESVIGDDERERVDATTTYPNSAVGHLELDEGGQSYLCSGFLIDDNSVLTSAHCAYTETGDTPNLIDSATFAPGRNRDVDPYGRCDVESAWAPDEYRLNGTVAFDFAVLNLADGCDAIGAETGTFGLFARSGSYAQVRATVQGYPGEAVFGTQKRMRGKLFRSQKRLVFYPMDTTGGQSGSPVWKQKASGDCVGPCGLAVHGYGTDAGSAGVWHDNNAGIRLTPFRIGQILDIAGQND